MPFSSSSSHHNLFYIPARFLPWLPLLLFLPPSAVLASTPFTSTNPKTACAPAQLPPWGRSPQPSWSRGPCCHHRLSPRGLRCSSQALRSPAHLSSHVFTFPKLLMFILTFGSAASIAACQGQACLQRCGLKARVGSALVFAKQELCFCQALSPWLLRAHF